MPAVEMAKVAKVAKAITEVVEVAVVAATEATAEAAAAAAAEAAAATGVVMCDTMEHRKYGPTVERRELLMMNGPERRWLTMRRGGKYHLHTDYSTMFRTTLDNVSYKSSRS